MAKKAKKQIPLHDRLNVEDAFVTILQHHLDLLREWEPLSRSWDNIEGVHQMRVTLRRMRSALNTFRPALPKKLTRPWGDEMRYLAGEFGAARDLDVFISELLDAVQGRLPLPGAHRMRTLAEAQRERAYQQVRAVLDGERYANFKAGLKAWLDSHAWREQGLTSKQQKRLHAPVPPFARKRLERQTHAVLEAGSHVDQDSVEEMHRLRIECKKLRYTAEFFTPLFVGMDEFIGHLKGLQDLLGVMHDVAVLPGLLQPMLGESQDPEVLHYAGGLVGWRAHEYENLRDSFGQRWDEFTQAKRPWWRKS